ncbi:MAG: hypothetical protein M3O32_10810 [Actinomycetota bacterium]|nr:hypothetical protein [Actinomycetota bacterium]
MRTGAVPEIHFLVEWYGHDAAAAGAEAIARRFDAASVGRPNGMNVHLLVALTLPGEDFTFAVFSAPSADAVTDTCNRLGWPADRITPGARLVVPAALPALLQPRVDQRDADRSGGVDQG